MQTETLNSDAPAASGNESIAALAKMGEMWKDRAQVLTFEKEFEVEMMYSAEHDDFLDQLIPFHQHPRYSELDDELRTKILSSGWIAYNDKSSILNRRSSRRFAMKSSTVPCRVRVTTPSDGWPPKL